MSYELEFGPKAFDRLPRSLPAEVLQSFNNALDALARSPTTLSRPAVFPYPPRGQVFHHHCDFEGTRYYFAVFFYISQDERRLQVFTITFDSQPWQPRGDKPK